MLLDENPSKSQAGLARATGARPASISDWVNDRTKSINSKYLTSAANYFGVSSDWLATGKGPKQGQDGHAVGSPASLSITAPTAVAQGLEAISAALAQMTDEQREVMAGKLASLARAPDSHTLKKSISESLGSTSTKPDF